MKNIFIEKRQKTSRPAGLVFRFLGTGPGLVFFLLLSLAGAMAGLSHAEDIYMERSQEDPFLQMDGVLSLNVQNVHASGLALLNHTDIEQYFGLRMHGQLNPNIDFFITTHFIQPSDKNMEPYFGSGRRFLDNVVINFGYGHWKAHMGLVWINLSLLSVYDFSSRRPLVFDRDPEGGLALPGDNYPGYIRYGFINEDVIVQSEQYFSGGRGDYLWRNRPLMGLYIENSELPGGGYIKLFSGKAEDYFTNNKALSESGGRIGCNLEKISPIKNLKAEVNVYNRTNDRGEIIGLQGDPTTLLENNTVIEPLVGWKAGELLELEAERAQSYYQTTSLTAQDWAWRIKGTFFLDQLTGSPEKCPLILQYQRIHPDFIGRRNAVLDNAYLYPDNTRNYYTNFGDFNLPYNNLETMLLDARFKIGQTLLRLVYGAGNQIIPTNNHVSMTHFLDGIHYNGALWWQLFYSNYGKDKNPALDAYNASGAGSRQLTTDYWRGNSETFFLSDNQASLKHISFFCADLRQELGSWLGLDKNFVGFHVYSEFQTLNNQMVYSPWLQSGTLFYQSTLQAVLMVELAKPFYVIGQYGAETWYSDKCSPAVHYYDDSLGGGFDYVIDEGLVLYTRLKHHVHRDYVLTGNYFAAEQIWVELKKYF